MSIFNPEIHHRKSVRLKGYDYSRPGCYFVTIDLHNIRCMFGGYSNGQLILNDIGKITQKYWQAIPSHFSNVQLDEYVIMPDHIHGILWLKSNRKMSKTRRECKGVQLNALTPPPDRQTINQYYSKISPKSGSLSVIIRNFKSTVKRWCNKNGYPQFKWHRNYFERVIRNKKELLEIRRYIKINPLKKALPRNRGKE